MPRYSWCDVAYEWICWLALCVARLRQRAKSSGDGRSAESQLSRSSRSTMSVAIWLAISPAAAPPMPSATMKSVPLGPDLCARTAGWSEAMLVFRSATTNESSLCSRVRPTSVRPNTLTSISADVDSVIAKSEDGCRSRTVSGNALLDGLEPDLKKLGDVGATCEPFVGLQQRTARAKLLAFLGWVGRVF